MPAAAAVAIQNIGLAITASAATSSFAYAAGVFLYTNAGLIATASIVGGPMNIARKRTPAARQAPTPAA
jgi:uncharacterized membrane protein YfcA